MLQFRLQVEWNLGYDNNKIKWAFNLDSKTVRDCLLYTKKETS